jgi:hypothetical protein
LVFTGALETVKERLNNNGFINIEIEEFNKAIIYFSKDIEFSKFISGFPGNPDYTIPENKSELDLILSSIILSLLLALHFYIPLSVQREGTLYWSFTGLMIVYMIYSMPVILLGGVPFSILVDKLVKYKGNRKISLLIHTLVYGLGGIMVFFLFIVVLSKGDILNDLKDSIQQFYIGIFGSILFYYIDCYQISKKKKRTWRNLQWEATTQQLS